jgi:hypothetical protein
MIAARMLADAGERAKRPCRYWDEHFRFADLPGVEKRVAFRFAGKVFKYRIWVPAKLHSIMPPSRSSIASDYLLVDSVFSYSTGNTPTLRASCALAFSLLGPFS